jgi:prepilin-type N-terminal cleavage/methylation domain-containing protein
MRCRRGTTLVELLVTLTIMGVLLGVVTLAVRRIAEPASEDPYHMVGDSLRAAAASGQAISLLFVVHGRSVAATVFPDGSIVSDSVLAIDRLSGKTSHVR